MKIVVFRIDFYLAPVSTFWNILPARCEFAKMVLPARPYDEGKGNTENPKL